MSLPIVAIVGRPNVGKSTLFNRLAGKRLSIVADEPGTTRDRIFAEAEWVGRRFFLVDTGGIEVRPEDTIRQQVQRQVQIAIHEADAIIFVVDAAAGITPGDEEATDLLRKAGRPLVLAANKADNLNRELSATEFYRLGMGEPIPISAYHSRGILELAERIVALLPQPAEEPAREAAARIAIVGRPNVGKSMLLNAIVGEERATVSEVPGTTRDAIDVNFAYEGQPVTIVDTAGIKKPGHIQPGVDYYSVVRALRAIERADVAVLLLDATEMVTAQDTHIAGHVVEACKGLILGVNKWDLANDLGLGEDECTHLIQGRFKFAPYAPVLYLSALKGTGVAHLMRTALDVYQERHKRVATAAINRLIEQAAGLNPPPPVKGKRLNILYVTQADVNPPTFVFAVNNPELVHFSYRRYLENKIREAYGFSGTAIKFVFKARRS